MGVARSRRRDTSGQVKFQAYNSSCVSHVHFLVRG